MTDLNTGTSMNTKNKIALTGIVITAILLFAYIAFRYGMIEKEYVSGLSPLTDRIALQLAEFEKEKDVRDRDLSRFLKIVSGRYRPIALLALGDRSGGFLAAGKNARYITSTETFDSILAGFTRGDFEHAKNGRHLVRYFDQMKFYLFLKESPAGNMLLAFPFRLQGKLLVKLLLELLLLVLLAVIFTTSYYLFLVRRGIVDGEAAYTMVPVLPGKKEVLREGRRAAKSAAKAAEESLQSYVFDLFSHVASRYAAHSMALSVMNKSSSALEKMFELKGETFIRVDSPGKDAVRVESEIGDELKKSSIMVLEKGRKLVIPVLYRNSLLAALHLAREAPFRGPEIGDIRASAERITGPLSEYLVVNDVLIDGATGLFSKSYFQMKYDELLARSRAGGPSFGVILISIFGPESLTGEGKNGVLWQVSRRLRKVPMGAAVVSRYDDCLAVLLPETGREGTEALGKRLEAEISLLRVKADRHRTLEMRPVIGAASSDMREARNEPLQAALVKISKEGDTEQAEV